MDGDGVLAAAERGVVVACEAKAGEGLAGMGFDPGRLRMVVEPSAGDALTLALERIEAGDFDDAATLDANYLRRTDAEIFAKAAAPRESR
jgi:tRNA threonylcarbamoyladenosine biosynthesis protein TsaB